MTSDRKPDRRSLASWALAALISVSFAFLGAQLQQADDAATQNQKEIEQLESLHRGDVARLDEANRSRREQIADLEERIARVEERTSG